MRGVVCANQLWHHLLVFSPVKYKHNILSRKVLLSLDFRAITAMAIDYSFTLIVVLPVKAGFYIPILSVLLLDEAKAGVRSWQKKAHG